LPVLGLVRPKFSRAELVQNKPIRGLILLQNHREGEGEGSQAKGEGEEGEGGCEEEGGGDVVDAPPMCNYVSLCDGGGFIPSSISTVS
jgi:hypothetical protein